LIVRYEDRRADPGATLRQILTFFGEPYSEAEIAEAVDFTSFDKLKKLESQGFFRYGGMSLRRGGDPDAFKLRRGKVEGYRDYFDAEQLAQMDEKVAKRLSPVFGYGETSARVSG
jgi:Sulfotransferase domain